MRFFWADLNGIIVDYSWYADRVLEIDSWCRESFGYEPREGMYLTFEEESHKAWFILKWNCD